MFRADEREVARKVAAHLQEKYPNKNVQKYDIECTGGGRRIDWRADVVVGQSVPYDLCVECKTSFEYRKGIGQAIAYNVHNYAAGFACTEVPKDVQEIVEMSPIHGWSVSEDGVEHFSTNGPGESEAVYYGELTE